MGRVCLVGQFDVALGWEKGINEISLNYYQSIVEL